MSALSILRKSRILAGLAMAGLLAGCVSQRPSAVTANTATLAPPTSFTGDLLALPQPIGKISTAVYGFRDQTGQYRSAPDSSFSTAVTQGGAALLIEALRDSGWFLPVERENLQNLLTERKIVRALEVAPAKGEQPIKVPQLIAAAIIIEGGVIAYESNVRTGGIGARFLGVGLSTQYRVDQVTINLRAIDIRSGQILQSVSTTKTIYSYEIHPSVFKFVNFKGLAEFEAGMTRNEPAQLCIKEAIEAGITYLIVQGIRDGTWKLRDEKQMSSKLIQRYLNEINSRPTQAGSVGAPPTGS